MTKYHKETLFYRFSNLLRFVFQGKNQVYCSCNHDACHITRKCPFGRFTCKHGYYFLSKSIEILRKPPETMNNIEPRRPVQRSGRTIEFMSVCPSVNSSCKHEGVVTFYRIPSKKVYISYMFSYTYYRLLLCIDVRPTYCLFNEFLVFFSSIHIR